MSETSSKSTSPVKPTRVDWIRYVTLISLWGSAFGLSKIAVSEISPLIVSTARIWIAIGLLYGWMVYRKHKLPQIWPKPDRRWLWFIPVGITGSALPFFLNSWALQSLDSGLVSILLATMPLTVAFLAHFTIKGDQFTMGKIIGLALGLLGVTVLVGPSVLAELGGPSTLAQLAVLLTAMIYAGNTVLIHFTPETPPSVSATMMLLVGGILLMPFAIVDGLHSDLPSIKAMASILILGLGATGFGSILYMQTIRSAGPSFLATANFFVPPFAVFLGVMFLNEKPSTLAFIALGIITLGILVERKKPK